MGGELICGLEFLWEDVEVLVVYFGWVMFENGC